MIGHSLDVSLTFFQCLIVKFLIHLNRRVFVMCSYIFPAWCLCLLGVPKGSENVPSMPFTDTDRYLFETAHDKMACATIEDSDQPGHPPCLIRVFPVRMKKAWLVLSVSSSSWCLGRAVVCDCGTPWTFLLPYQRTTKPTKWHV